MYAASNAKLNQRTADYYSGLAAAEAATEKALSQITTDFRTDGDRYILSKLDVYRQAIPTTSESALYGNFKFQDLSGRDDRNEVQFYNVPGFEALGGTYGQLRAFKDRIRVLSAAEVKATTTPVFASVYQDIELTRIPIFQFAIFYNVPLEFTPAPPMVINGPVHCNTNIYLNPAGALTFNNDLTSSGTIVEGPISLGPLNMSLGGSITYNGRHDSGVSTMSLPIGTNSSPAAVRQTIEVPPASESSSSSLGQQRYYNLCDLIVVVSNNTVKVTSGLWNNFTTALTTNEVNFLITTNTQFASKRENKTIKAINLDISKLVLWNATNTLIRPSLPWHDVKSIYVADRRTQFATNEGGLRLINGTNLPPLGLTVATSSPLYIQGDYNCPAGALNTTNTSGTLPASVAGDAITILSTAWADNRSTNALSGRIAANTTVNAAILAGIVATSSNYDSGGVENFLRYLEDWNTKTNTYNGSMVCMFYSQTAIGPWTQPANSGLSPGDDYNPPNRNWSLDQNFQYGSKIPPVTPNLTILVRANWRTPAAFTTNVASAYLY